jgi:hypothetical protein
MPRKNQLLDAEDQSQPRPTKAATKAIKQQQSFLAKRANNLAVDGLCVWNSLMTGLMGIGHEKIDQLPNQAKSFSRTESQKVHQMFLQYIKSKILVGGVMMMNKNDENVNKRVNRKKKNSSDDDDAPAKVSSSSDEEQEEDNEFIRSKKERLQKLELEQKKLRDKIKEVRFNNEKEEFSDAFVDQIILTIRNMNVTLDGHLVGACDPLLIAICAIFDVNIVHVCAGSDHIYTVLHPKKTIKLSSSIGHMSGF